MKHTNPFVVVRTAVPTLLKRDLLYRSGSGYLVYDYLFADYLRGI